MKQISERLMKVSFKAAEFREFMNEHVNDRGFLNLCISPRKEVGQWGDTHTCFLDTWKPGQRAEQPATKPTKAAEPKQEDLNINPPGLSDDDIPPF